VVIAVAAYGIWRAFGPAPAGGAPTTTGPNATRIVVAWLDNRTGDSTLAEHGALAAEWIIQGLAEQQFGELVASSDVRAWMTGDLASSPTRARDLATRTNAGLLVSGSYFRRADSLEYRAEDLDVTSGSLLGSVGPFRGLPDDVTPAGLPVPGSGGVAWRSPGPRDESDRRGGPYQEPGGVASDGDSG
jgi:hypothetical protein